MLERHPAVERYYEQRARKVRRAVALALVTTGVSALAAPAVAAPIRDYQPSAAPIRDYGPIRDY